MKSNRRCHSNSVQIIQRQSKPWIHLLLNIVEDLLGVLLRLLAGVGVGKVGLIMCRISHHDHTKTISAAYLVATLNLTGVSFGTVDLAGLLHLGETVDLGLLSLKGKVEGIRFDSVEYLASGLVWSEEELLVITPSSRDLGCHSVTDLRDVYSCSMLAVSRHRRWVSCDLEASWMF